MTEFESFFQKEAVPEIICLLRKLSCAGIESHIQLRRDKTGEITVLESDLHGIVTTETIKAPK